MTNERHADPLDEATALATSLTEGAIAAARMASAPETHPDFDGEHCVECGAEMPAARLAMGRIRCIHCQTELEHKGKQQARPTWGGLGSW